MASEGFSITEVAEQLNTTVRALRYYEGFGLLEPSRSSGRARRYCPDVRAKAAMIVSLRRVGVSLAEIEQAILGDGLCDREPIRRLLQKARAETRERLAEIERLMASAGGLPGSF